MGELVGYGGAGGDSAGYLATPVSGQRGPAVIVIQERWGLVSHITAVADRFAEAGFVALAPDLHHGGSNVELDPVDSLAAGSVMERVGSALRDAAEFLAGRSEVFGGVGCVGFCAGGSVALWSATVSERIVATAGFYPILPWGRVSSEWSDYSGKSAVIHCAEEDGTSRAEGVQATRRAIESAGGGCTLYDYPGTRHSFFNDDRPETFHQPASVSAWARTLEFLRRRLG